MLSALEIEALARSLVRAQQTSLGVEVTTHVVYPNGEQVKVVVSLSGDGFVVNDASFAAMYLASIGIKPSQQQVARIRAQIAHYGCELREGRVSKQSSAERLVDAIALVANASRSVADFGVEARRQVDSDFQASVIERLREAVGARVKEREEVKGASGRTYRVGGVVLDRSQSKPVAFVEAIASRGTVADRFAEFFDLQGPYSDVERLAVYDDSHKWPASDIRLLEQVSRTARFSESSRDFEALVLR